jgi:curli biogenesis system outer membrane secretion channel CsgG
MTDVRRGSVGAGYVRRWLLNIVATMALPACVTAPPNSSGLAARQMDVSTVGPVSGIGIEGQDYVSMTDQMIRDILASQMLAGRSKAPRVVIDSQYFKVGGSQAINRDLITERLRVNLNRAAQGRMSFIDRTHLDAIERERNLKRHGITDVGTTGLTKAVAGSDFLLRGAISSQDARSLKTGLAQRYNQISFEMVDVETSEIVWSGLYEFARVAADDVVYR